MQCVYLRIRLIFLQRNSYYDTLPQEYTYKNILMPHRPYTSENIGHNYSSVKRYKDEIDRNPAYDFVRENVDFLKAYKRLCVE